VFARSIWQAEWVRLRKRPFVWLGFAVLTTLWWLALWSNYSSLARNPAFSLGRESGALYESPNWLAYSYFLRAPNFETVLCLAVIGALWGKDDLDEGMLNEHKGRLLHFSRVIMASRIGSLIVYSAALQLLYACTAAALRIAIHRSVFTVLAHVGPAITYSFTLTLCVSLSGLLFTYVWRDVAGGVLTVLIAWWLWPESVSRMVEFTFNLAPNAVAFVLMALFPQANFGVINDSWTAWIVHAVHHGAMQFPPNNVPPGFKIGIPLGFIKAGKPLAEPVLYAPGPTVSFGILGIEFLLLALLANAIMKRRVRSIYEGRDPDVKPADRTTKRRYRHPIVLILSSISAGVIIWTYIISPALNNLESSRNLSDAEKVFAQAKSIAISHRLDKFIVARSVAGSVTEQDVWMYAIYSQPSYTSAEHFIRHPGEAVIRNAFVTLVTELQFITAYLHEHPGASKGWQKLYWQDNFSVAPDQTRTFAAAMRRVRAGHIDMQPSVVGMSSELSATLFQALLKSVSGRSAAVSTEQVNKASVAASQEDNKLARLGAKMVTAVSVKQLMERLPL